MTTTDYGFIGVGRMGAHMARRLLKAGISLTVYDTSKEATDDLAKTARKSRARRSKLRTTPRSRS